MLKLLFVFASAAGKQVALDSANCAQWRIECAAYYQVRNSLVQSLKPTIDMINNFVSTGVQNPDIKFLQDRSKEMEYLINLPTKNCDIAAFAEQDFKSSIDSIKLLSGKLPGIASKMNTVMTQLSEGLKKGLSAYPSTTKILKDFAEFPKRNEVIKMGSVVTCPARSPDLKNNNTPKNLQRGK